MLNLERLRVLQAVARHGSVTAAAAELHVTTSAVSQQLAKLEHESGTTLVERSGRGIRLTDTAHLLAEHASALLSMAELAQADVNARAGTVTGRLVLASLPTATRGLAAPALSQLARAHPALQVQLTEADSSESIPALVQGTVDLVIAHDWSNAPLAAPEGLAKTLLAEDLADIAVPAAHPFAGATAEDPRCAVELAELGAGPWICGTPGTSCHDWLTFTLRSAGLEPQFAHTANEYATQLALVAAGLGIAVMPRLGRGDVPAGVHMIAVRPTLRRNIYALWRTTAARRPAINAAVSALSEAAAHVSA
ncbi:MAG TPA: LysR family transcriptional regulator [Streptosporangiaceae bacterium]|nr:LysR family transcriptional regulator [Streptosporangiaceae bacterium]